MKKLYWLGAIVMLFGILYMRNEYVQNKHIRFVNNMGVGINFGNALDSTGISLYLEDADVAAYEMAWNNPQITDELFEMVKEAGFGVVRIPVSWEEHIDENGTIDELWLNRVEEVVRMGLSHDLYIILNTHHESWVIPTKEKEDETETILTAIWQQVAERFSDVDEHLIFEVMNEPRLQDTSLEWTNGNDEMVQVINELNQKFVDVIRESGGENRTRYLMIEPYAGRYQASLELEIPEDEYIIVSVHSYEPYQFAQNEYGTDEWSADNASDIEGLVETVEALKEQFIDNHIPVMITEFGCVYKQNDEAREAWVQYYTTLMRDNQITYIWWDNGGQDFALMNRYNYTWEFPRIVEILLNK
ncbi:MAG: glycoside hydrolase family 5 protein [Eubacteriales bacterium]